MRSSHLLLSALVGLVAVTSVSADYISDAGRKDFTEGGYPALTLLASLLFVGLSIYFGAQHGGSDYKGSNSSLPLSFRILNILSVFFGIFLIFGPGEVYGMGSPKVNVLAFQIVCLSCIGFYAIYTNLKNVTQAYFVLNLVTILSLLGCFPLLGHNTGAYDANQTACLNYFAEPNSTSLNRCDDHQWLNLVRVFSLFTIFTLSVQVFQVFVLLSNGQRTVPKQFAGIGGPGASLLGGNDSDAFPSQQSYNQSTSASAAAPAPYVAPAANAPASATGYQQFSA